jgi:hypothetical protein
MSDPTKIKWRIAGEQVVSCNCSWGCPCQFNALPTTGHCEATGAWQIKEGYFGNIRLDGLRFAGAVWWPGAIHEGNGVWRTIIDEQATNEQREALIALANGQHGGRTLRSSRLSAPIGSSRSSPRSTSMSIARSGVRQPGYRVSSSRM